MGLNERPSGARRVVKAGEARPRRSQYWAPWSGSLAGSRSQYWAPWSGSLVRPVSQSFLKVFSTFEKQGLFLNLRGPFEKTFLREPGIGNDKTAILRNRGPVSQNFLKKSGIGNGLTPAHTICFKARAEAPRRQERVLIITLVPGDSARVRKGAVRTRGVCPKAANGPACAHMAGSLGQLGRRSVGRTPRFPSRAFSPCVSVLGRPARGGERERRRNPGGPTGRGKAEAAPEFAGADRLGDHFFFAWASPPARTGAGEKGAPAPGREGALRQVPEEHPEPCAER